MQNLQNLMQNQTTVLLQWPDHLSFLFLVTTTKSSHTFILLTTSSPKRKRFWRWSCRTQDPWSRFSNRNHNPNHPPFIHMPILFSIDDFLDPINEVLINIPHNSLMITPNSLAIDLDLTTMVERKLFCHVISNDDTHIGWTGGSNFDEEMENIWCTTSTITSSEDAAHT